MALFVAKINTSSRKIETGHNVQPVDPVQQPAPAFAPEDLLLLYRVTQAMIFAPTMTELLAAFLSPLNLTGEYDALLLLINHNFEREPLWAEVMATVTGVSASPTLKAGRRLLLPMEIQNLLQGADDPIIEYGDLESIRIRLSVLTASMLRLNGWSSTTLFLLRAPHLPTTTGMVMLNGRQPNRLDERLRSLYQPLIPQMAALLDKRHTIVQTMESLNFTRTLYHASRQLAEADTPHTVLRIIFEHAAHRGAVNATLMRLHTNDSNRPTAAEVIAVTAAADQQTIGYVGLVYPLLPGAVSDLWLLNPREPLIIEDAADTPQLTPRMREILMRSNISASVVLPLLLGSRWVGLIVLNWAQPMQIAPSDQQFYQAIITQAAAVLDSRALLAQNDMVLGRLQEAQRIAQIGDFEIDLRTHEMHWSRELKQIIGREPQNSADSLSELQRTIHPDDCAIAAAYLRQAVEAGIPYQLRCRFVQPDFSIRHVEIRGEVLTDAQGTPIKTQGIIQDITERVEAERMLRSVEERLHLLIQGIEDGIWDWNLETNEVVSTPRCKEMLGYAPDEIGDRVYDWDALCHPDDLARVNSTIADYLASQRSSYETEARMRHKDGHYRWIRTRGVALRDDDGRPYRMIGSHTDITTRKQAELALHESEQRFRMMADQAPVLIWLTDLAGDIIYCNKTWLNFTGKPLEDEIGAGWLKDIHPEDREYARMIYLDALENKTQYTGEYRLRRHDGVYRWMLETGVPRFDENGGFVGYIGSCIDITERKEFEQAISRLNLDLSTQTAQLQAAYGEMEAFTYSVSHDLRAPLRAINGFSQILFEQYGDQLAADAGHYLERVRANAVRMGELIDDLLMLSRVGRRALELDRVELTRVAQAALAEVYTTADYPLSCIDIRPLPTCRCDPRLMQQVFANLISNALKFSRNHPAPLVIVDSYRDAHGGFVCFVRDNGAGFDMAYADKLFGVFQRLHDNSQYEGTGVGLAIVQRIIQKHNGRVWAEAAPNEGATFYFTIRIEA
jgi:PAS domain S-box-containing protein